MGIGTVCAMDTSFVQCKNSDLFSQDTAVSVYEKLSKLLRERSFFGRMVLQDFLDSYIHKDYSMAPFSQSTFKELSIDYESKEGKNILLATIVVGEYNAVMGVQNSIRPQ